MSPSDEIRILLYGLQELHSKTPRINREGRTIEIIEHLEKISNLNHCLTRICWEVFGRRETDGLHNLGDCQQTDTTTVEHNHVDELVLRR